MVSTILRPGADASDDKRSYARIPSVFDVPNLLQVQLSSFNWLKTDGLRELFEEISPIEDQTGDRFELTFDDHYFEEPRYTEEECREKEITYTAALYVTVTLRIKAAGAGQGEIKEQTLFLGDIPMMTSTGTFIINGAERVVVSQLVRSPGVYFTADLDPNTGRPLASAKLIPYRGAWMEFETSNRDVISVKVDRKRKTPVSTLLRALGFETDRQIMELFEDIDTNEEHPFVATTIEKDPGVTNQNEALIEFYRRLRPGEPPSAENARTLINNLFFNNRRYDLGRVGRYKLNRRLGHSQDGDARTLNEEDIVNLLRMMVKINNGVEEADDIDHLGNRRVRAVGELIQNQIRVGLLRMERVIKERMTTQLDAANTTPAALINIRPVVAAVREFYGGSQLSQFMDQTNPLAELTHKRRLSALGPGGLSRRTRGLRRARRPPLPLRANMPDRDTGRAEHRTARVAGDVRAHQRFRLHRDALPESTARDFQQDAPAGGPQDHGGRGGRGRPDHPQGGWGHIQGRRHQDSLPARAHDIRGAIRVRRDHVSARGRGGERTHRPGELAYRPPGPVPGQRH